MPDRRTHRGPAPEDSRVFARAAWPRLRSAVEHLSWLLSRGYAVDSSLALVGNRFDLVKRQREAVRRAACSDEERDARGARERAQIGGGEIWIDGHNVLTTVEAALAGGVVLVGRDGSYRDMASMHGSWRRVEETLPAIEGLLVACARLGVTRVRWLLDSPVSNSARLRTWILEAHARLEASRTMPPLDVELVPDPDRELAAATHVVATADSGILDRCARWHALSRLVVGELCAAPWIVDLSDR